MKYCYTLLFIVLGLLSANAENSTQNDGLYAEINTTKGKIKVSLFADQMPISVGNFVALAEGKQKNDILKEYRKKHLYNGSTVENKFRDLFTTFQNSTVSTSEGIGYQIPVEHNDSLANLRNTLNLIRNRDNFDGSQFMFSFRPFNLFGPESVPIGQIVEGEEVAKSLNKGDAISEITILRVGKQAKKYKGSVAVEQGIAKLKAEEEQFKAEEFDRLVTDLEELTQSDDEAYVQFAKRKLFAIETAEVLSSGVRIVKTRETDGKLAQKGDAIRVGYTGYLANGNVFDTSYTNPRPMLFVLGKGEVIKGFDEVFSLLRVGEKATVIIPSSSAYGREGAGRKIPPYTSLIFDVTFVEVEK